jgi:hypothetical protein
MSDLQKPEYKHADLIAGFLILGSLILSGVFGTVSGLIAWGIALLEISFFGAIWVAACHALGGRIFQFFFVKRRHEPILQRSHGLFKEVDYFLVKPCFPKSITWRFVQSLSVFLLFASTVAYYFPSSGPRSPITETAPFVYAGLIALVGVMPFLALLWLYEDSGVRSYRRDNDTIGRVGTLFEQFLFGSGSASAFYRLVTSLSGPLTETVGWALAVLILFPSICFLLTLAFHEAFELEIINKILSIASANNFPQREISLI